MVEPVTPCADTILTFNSEDGAKGYVRWRLDDGPYAIVAPVAEGNDVYQIMRPPDPVSPLAIISIMTDNGRPSVAANVLVNVATGAFKVLGTEYRDNPKYIAAWLPLGWAVWIDDQGEVHMGSLATQQSLHAPARMTDIWFVAPDRFLTRDEAYQFWTFDRADNIWYPALLPEENAKIDGRWFKSAGVFEDGRHIFLFFQEYSAILDVDSGTVQIVSPFASATEYYTITTGTEGDIFLPAQQIKGTPYWFLQNEGVFREIAHTTYLPRSTTIAATELSYVSTGFVIDSRTGAVLGHEALGIPTELAIYNATLSPDETQLAVEVIAAIETLGTNTPRVAQTWFYSFATGEPRLERVEDGAFGGWGSESAGAVDALPACASQEISIDLAQSSALAPAATTTPAPPLDPLDEITPTPIEPILTAARVFPFSWSPDSTTLAYWTFSEEEVATDFLLPPGELHFYDVRSEESCRSPVSVAYGYGVPVLTWLPNGKIQVTIGQGIMEGSRCTDDFVAAENPQLYRPNPSLSLDGRYEAHTTVSSDNYYTTSITNVTTGEVLSTIEWQAPERLGDVGVGGEWLTDERFLIYETTEEPLLLTVGEGTTRVASELFGLPLDSICQAEPCQVTLQAVGAMVEGTDDYHIVLYGVGSEAEFPPLRLYHSESGAVEELGMRQQGGFSPDGHALLLYEEHMVDEGRYTVLIAPVDSTDRQVHPLLNTATSPFPVAWSPDSTQVAIGYTDGATTFSTQDGRAIRSWSTPGWTIAPGSWSPDGQYLALGGLSLQGQGEALFIVNKDKE